MQLVIGNKKSRKKILFLFIHFLLFSDFSRTYIHVAFQLNQHSMVINLRFLKKSNIVLEIFKEADFFLYDYRLT